MLSRAASSNGATLKWAPRAALPRAAPSGRGRSRYRTHPKRENRQCGERPGPHRGLRHVLRARLAHDHLVRDRLMGDVERADPDEAYGREVRARGAERAALGPGIRLREEPDGEREGRPKREGRRVL